MSEIATAFVRIRPDTTGFKSETEAGVRGAFTGIGKLLTGTLALGAGFEIGKNIVEDAASVQKSIETITAEFGAAGRAVADFGDKGAASLGISAKLADATSARFGILFHNLGIGQAQAGQMTVGFEKLAGSIAAIRGIDPATVLQNLPLAAAGNVRSLKQLGIAIDQTQLKFVALRLGLIQTTGQALTPAQKAIAIYTIATQNLGQYQQQAAAHSGDLSNVTRRLSAEFSNAKESIGRDLLPTAAELATFLADRLPHAIEVTRADVKALVSGLDELTAPIGGVKQAVEGLLVVFAASKVLAFAEAIKDDLVAKGMRSLEASAAAAGKATAAQASATAESGAAAAGSSTAIGRLGATIAEVSAQTERLGTATAATAASVEGLGTAASASLGGVERSAAVAAGAADGIGAYGAAADAAGASAAALGTAATAAGAGLGTVASEALTATSAVEGTSAAATTASAALDALAAAGGGVAAVADGLNASAGVAAGALATISGSASAAGAALERAGAGAAASVAGIESFAAATDSAAAAAERLAVASSTIAEGASVAGGSVSGVAAEAQAAAAATSDVGAAASASAAQIARLDGPLAGAAEAAGVLAAANRDAAASISQTAAAAAGYAASLDRNAAAALAAAAGMGELEAGTSGAAAATERLNIAAAAAAGNLGGIGASAATAAAATGSVGTAGAEAAAELRTIVPAMDDASSTAAILGDAAGEASVGVEGLGAAATGTAAAVGALAAAQAPASAGAAELGAGSAAAAAAIGEEGGAAAITARAIGELALAEDGATASAARVGAASVASAAEIRGAGAAAGEAAVATEAGAAASVAAIGTTRAAAAGLLSVVGRLGEVGLIVIGVELAVNRKKLASFFDTSNFLGSRTVDQWVARNIPGARWLDNTIFGEKTVNRLVGAQSKLQGGTSKINQAFSSQGAVSKVTTTAVHETEKGTSEAFKTAKDASSATWSFITGTAVPGITAAVAKLDPVFAAVGRLGHAAFADVSEIAGSFAATFKGALAGVRGAWDAVGPSIISSGASLVRGVEAVWADFGGTITAVVRVALGNVRQIVVDAIDAIRGVLDILTGIVTGDWSKAWDGLQTVVSSALDAITSTVRAWGTIIEAIFESVWKNIEKITLEGVKAALGPIADIPTQFTIAGQKIGFANPAAAARKQVQGIIDSIHLGAAGAKTAKPTVFDPVFKAIAEQQKLLQAKIKQANDANPKIESPTISVTGGVPAAVSASQKVTGAIHAAHVKAVSDARKNIDDLSAQLKRLTASQTAGILSAQTAVTNLQQGLAQSITQEGRDVYDAVNQAKSNLSSIVSTLSGDIGQIIDRPLQTLQNRLGLQQNKLSLEQLRRSVLLPGGKSLSDDPTRALAQLRQLANASSTVSKPAIQSFILQYQSALLQVRQSQATIQKQSIDKNLGNLESAFANGKINASQFSKLLQGQLKKDGVNFRAVGHVLGGQFLDGFRGTLAGAILQVKALAEGPSVRAVGAGQIPAITHPLWVLQSDARDIAQKQRDLTKATNGLAAKQLKATEKTNVLLGQLTAAQKIVDDSKSKNPGKASKAAFQFSHTQG